MGLPGEQQEARERRADVRRKLGNVLLALGTWTALVLLVGPTRVPNESPQLGPATRDLVALRNFDDEEPVPDLALRQERAAAAVPVHYTLDREAAARRIDGLRAAFRLLRPQFRLYLSDRERLLGEQRAQKVEPGAVPAEVSALDRDIDEELGRLRPEFEALFAVRRAELNGDVFRALRKAGFSEEIELLLSDVAQVLLSQRIVRDVDRFEDDLARGVLDVSTGTRYDRASARGKMLDVETAMRQADDYVAEFVKQKKPSRLDDPILQAACKAMARSMVEPTFVRDMKATQDAEKIARAAVRPTRIVRFARGESLVKMGEVVTPAVQARVARMLRGVSEDPTPRSYVATALILLVTLGLFVGFAQRNLNHFRHRPRDWQLLAAILVVHALSLRGLVGLGSYVAEPGMLTNVMWIAALPYALGPTMATLFLRPVTAAPFSLLCAIVAGLLAHNSSFLHSHQGFEGLVALIAIVLGLAGVYAARHFRQRSDLVLGAMTISGAAVACAGAVALFTAPVASDLFDLHNALILLMGVGSGVSSYLLLAALTPIFESIFNRLTDIKLLELTSMNHPALRLLATQTPGTFTHSVMVGNLAQAGCDAIGANGLLARVGAYYHDLGKTRAPRYFGENQAGENPHDKLKPHLSALIIKSHVKDGIKILNGYGLPDEIVDFVSQHHGTGLIAHFYRRAQREALETGEEINEADFRYPGPKPQRRETALLMLADSVEAAAKSLPEPNQARVQGLVRKIIAGKLEDGQFDECDLTLRELALVEQAFIKAVVGIHHTRPVYLPPLGEPAEVAAPPPRPELGLDDVRNVALLVDGGVGPRLFASVRDTQVPGSATETLREARQSEPDGFAQETESPQAPTAIVASKTYRGRRAS